MPGTVLIYMVALSVTGTHCQFAILAALLCMVGRCFLEHCVTCKALACAMLLSLPVQSVTKFLHLVFCVALLCMTYSCLVEGYGTAETCDRSVHTCSIPYLLFFGDVRGLQRIIEHYATMQTSDWCHAGIPGRRSHDSTALVSLWR